VSPTEAGDDDLVMPDGVVVRRDDRAGMEGYRWPNGAWTAVHESSDAAERLAHCEHLHSIEWFSSPDATVVELLL
jgi:hypothetical protein